LTLYHKDSHEKYLQWSEEKIAVDLAYRCFIDGVLMDPFSDVEDHAVEICGLFVQRGVWKECVRRMEKVGVLAREGM
jgi:hypothetical protein